MRTTDPATAHVYMMFIIRLLQSQIDWSDGFQTSHVATTVRTDRQEASKNAVTEHFIHSEPTSDSDVIASGQLVADFGTARTPFWNYKIAPFGVSKITSFWNNKTTFRNS